MVLRIKIVCLSISVNCQNLIPVDFLQRKIDCVKYRFYGKFNSKKYIITFPTKMETGERKLQPNPRKTASVISILFFGWTIPFFKRSYKKVLDPNDVSEALVIDQSSTLGDRLER